MDSAYFLSVMLNPLPPLRRFFTIDFFCRRVVRSVRSGPRRSCGPSSHLLLHRPVADSKFRDASRRFAAFAAPALTAGQSRLQQRNRRTINQEKVCLRDVVYRPRLADGRTVPRTGERAAGTFTMQSNDGWDGCDHAGSVVVAVQIIFVFFVENRASHYKKKTR